jgi:hypothetical protein
MIAFACCSRCCRATRSARFRQLGRVSRSLAAALLRDRQAGRALSPGPALCQHRDLAGAGTAQPAPYPPQPRACGQCPGDAGDRRAALRAACGRCRCLGARRAHRCRRGRGDPRRAQHERRDGRRPTARPSPIPMRSRAPRPRSTRLRWAAPAGAESDFAAPGGGQAPPGVFGWIGLFCRGRRLLLGSCFLDALVERRIALHRLRDLVEARGGEAASR